MEVKGLLLLFIALLFSFFLSIHATCDVQVSVAPRDDHYWIEGNIKHQVYDIHYILTNKYINK